MRMLLFRCVPIFLYYQKEQNSVKVLKWSLLKNYSLFCYTHSEVDSKRNDVVFAVLVNDALHPVVIFTERLVAPPLLQIAVQVVLTA